MTTKIFSLMWGDAWERYGRKFVESYDKFWPGNTELEIVTDRKLPTEHPQRPLETVMGYHDFLAKWKDDRRAMGYGSPDRKADKAARFWKHDALKWFPQALAPRAVMDGMSDGDVLAWFDADVETIASVRVGWVSELLDGHDMACLQRPRQHTEIGFWAARINRQTRKFADMFAGIYTTGAVFKLPEWHSAYVFDRALEHASVKVRNLNQAGVRGHPWPLTPLAEFTVHKKGKLKDA